MESNPEATAFRRRLRGAALFLGTFLALAYALDFAFSYCLRRNHDFKPAYAASGEIRAEVLILGSSRAMHSTAPEVIEARTGKSCYSLAYNGSSVEEHLLLLQLYLNHNPPPEALVFEMHRAYVNQGAGLILHPFNYAAFLDEPGVGPVIAREDPKLYRLRNLPLLKYALYSEALFKEAVKGAVQAFFTGSQEINYEKGYQPANRQWLADSRLRQPKPEIVVDSARQRYYERVVELARSHGVRVFLYTAPLYEEPDYERTYVHRFAEAHDIHYRAYRHLPLNSDKRYFFDLIHMNHEGALRFSETLAEDLAAFLRQRPEP